MWERKIIAALGLALCVSACAATDAAPPSVLSSSPAWPSARYFPVAPQWVTIAIEEPAESWGPVTIAGNDGNPPVRLSEEGVSIEASGSSTPPSGN